MRWCLFVLVRVRLVHGRTACRVFSQIPSIRDPVPLSASSRRGRRLATRTSDATRAFSCPPRAYWRIHGGGQCLNATHGRCATPVSPLETRSDSRRGCRRGAERCAARADVRGCGGSADAAGRQGTAWRRTIYTHTRNAGPRSRGTLCAVERSRESMPAPASGGIFRSGALSVTVSKKLSCAGIRYLVLILDTLSIRFFSSTLVRGGPVDLAEYKLWKLVTSQPPAKVVRLINLIVPKTHRLHRSACTPLLTSKKNSSFRVSLSW